VPVTRDGMHGPRELAATLNLAPRSGPARHAAPLASPGRSAGRGTSLSWVSRPHRFPTSQAPYRRSPQNPHRFRHHFCQALDAGMPLRDVQEAASHADPRTTMRYDRAPVADRSH